MRQKTRATYDTCTVVNLLSMCAYTEFIIVNTTSQSACMFKMYTNM